MSAPDHPAGRAATIEAALATSGVFRARIAVFTEDEMVVGVVSAAGVRVWCRELSIEAASPDSETAA